MWPERIATGVRGFLIGTALFVVLVGAGVVEAHPFTFTGGENCPVLQSPPFPGAWCGQVYQNEDGDICCNSWRAPPEPEPHPHGFTFPVEGQAENCYYGAARNLAARDARAQCPGTVDLDLDNIKIGGRCVSKNVCNGPDDIYDNYFTPSCIGWGGGRRRIESVRIPGLCHVDPQ